MRNLDWEDEDTPDGVDPKTAPVLITRRTEPGEPSRQATQNPARPRSKGAGALALPA